MDSLDDSGTGQASERRATIRDVAKRAGVSVSTVSYVMNDSGPVAEKTRAIVIQAVRDLGFEPNQSARRLRKPRVSSIGLIVPDLRNTFFAMVTEGVQQAAFERDVFVVLCATDASREREDYYVSMLKNRRLDGVVYLSGTGISTRALVELASRGPVVFVDEQLVGVDVPWVGSDNRGGGRAAAQHLLEAGHRRLAIIGGPAALWSAEQRLAGYREAMVGAGLDPDSVPVRLGDYREESGHAAARELLAADPDDRPTAILCANDLMAYGVMAYCREAGIRIPEDLSLVGFDDLPASSLVAPPLTTVRQAPFDMGHLAARLLLDLASGTGGETVEVPDLLPTALESRGSVVPPASS